MTRQALMIRNQMINRTSRTGEPEAAEAAEAAAAEAAAAEAAALVLGPDLARRWFLGLVRQW